MLAARLDGRWRGLLVLKCLEDVAFACESAGGERGEKDAEREPECRPDRAQEPDRMAAGVSVPPVTSTTLIDHVSAIEL